MKENKSTDKPWLYPKVKALKEKPFAEIIDQINRRIVYSDSRRNAVRLLRAVQRKDLGGNVPVC